MKKKKIKVFSIYGWNMILCINISANTGDFFLLTSFVIPIVCNGARTLLLLTFLDFLHKYTQYHQWTHFWHD